MSRVITIGQTLTPLKTVQVIHTDSVSIMLILKRENEHEKRAGITIKRSLRIVVSIKEDEYEYYFYR